MRQKNTKKMISFQHYDALDLWLKDLSISEGCTESTIAEAVLLGLRPGMLPTSPSAQGNILAWYSDANAVSQLFRSSFGYMAGHVHSTNYDPRTGLCLIRSLARILGSMDDRISVCSQSTLPYYMAALRDVYDILTVEHAKLGGDIATQLSIELRHTAAMIRQLDSAPYSVQCQHIVSIIQSNWDYLCRYPSTYRLVCAQLDMLEFPNDSATRLAVLQAIHEASVHWPD